MNYEARTSDTPIEKKIKRKTKNFKLKYSRILTCYSAILYLLEVHAQKGTVAPDDAVNMALLTPMQRIEWLRDQALPNDGNRLIESLISQYEQFLTRTDMPELKLLEAFGNRATEKEYMRSASQFSDTISDAIGCIGRGSKFHKMIVV